MKGYPVLRGFALGNAVGGIAGAITLGLLGHPGAASVFVVIAIVASAAHRALWNASHPGNGTPGGGS